MRLPLSVAIITLDEESNLPRCLESVKDLASEIVIVDSGSRDGTAEVARRFSAVFETLPWKGHVAQKNEALKRCRQPWVLFLDADEEVSRELAASLRELFSRGELPHAGYYLNRYNNYLGQWIEHAWNPEWRLRLARKDGANWHGLNPHDKLELQGSTGRLPGNLLHYPFHSLRDHLETELRYAEISAGAYIEAGRGCPWYKVIFSPFIAFLRVLLLKGAWLDGWRGWFIAGGRGFNTFAKYAFMIERLNLLRGKAPRA